MITEYKDLSARKAPGPWYTFTYDTGLRANRSDWQGDPQEIAKVGCMLSIERNREIRMRIHVNGKDRLYAIFRKGRKVR